MTSISETCACGSVHRIDDPQENWTAAALQESFALWRSSHQHAIARDRGLCMAEGPSFQGPSPHTPLCALPAGHLGAHHDGLDGMDWKDRNEAAASEPPHIEDHTGYPVQAQPTDTFLGFITPAMDGDDR